jgi:RPA family protein
MSKRWIAYKTAVRDLVKGEITEEGSLRINNLTINRARVLGTVVSKHIGAEDKYAFLVIDDGTETIRIRSFEDTVPIIKEVNLGDIIDVIGRIRKYEDEIYIIPEIIKKITNPNFEILRKLELLKQDRTTPKAEESIKSEAQEPDSETHNTAPVALITSESVEPEEEVIETTKLPTGQTKLVAETKIVESPRKTVIKAISQHDKGEGVDITFLFDKIGLDRETVHHVLNDLMNEGTIFEPRAGKVKFLE